MIAYQMANCFCVGCRQFTTTENLDDGRARYWICQKCGHQEHSRHGPERWKEKVAYENTLIESAFNRAIEKTGRLSVASIRTEHDSLPENLSVQFLGRCCLHFNQHYGRNVVSPHELWELIMTPEQRAAEDAAFEAWKAKSEGK